MTKPDDANDRQRVDEDLLAEFSTPLDELDPAIRDSIERTRTWARQQRAEGNVAPASNAQRHPDPIGLDDSLRPFPLKQTGVNQDEGPSRA